MSYGLNYCPPRLEKVKHRETKWPKLKHQVPGKSVTNMLYKCLARKYLHEFVHGIREYTKRQELMPQQIQQIRQSNVYIN